MPLTIPCPSACTRGLIREGRLGANDPDTVWRACTDCNGSGERVLHCDGCTAEAVEYFQGVPLCGVCVEEQKQGALFVGEDG
jgi:hypothetical protein